MTLRTARFLALLAWSGFLGSASGAAELQHAPAEWRGAWLVDRDAGASVVSALDSAQARALLGTTLSLDGGASLAELPCPSPSFQVLREAREDFTVDFRIQPADLGIKDDPVNVLNVECGNYAYSFIRLAADRGLVIYQGHFFGAAKRASQ